jgi:3-dehydrosphinganine reductase
MSSLTSLTDLFTFLTTSPLALTIEILLVFALPLLNKMFSKSGQFPVDGLTAIVTGGSQGLGLSFAQELAARGANVVIVARDTSKLQSAVDTLPSRAKNPGRQRFLHLSYDLRFAESASNILSEVTRWNGDEAPDILICCAGHCFPSFFADAPPEMLKDQMDTVYWSAAFMAWAAVNLWKQPSHKRNGNEGKERRVMKPTRHIVFTGSVLSFFPVAGYSPYTPAKAAMRALADSLNQELEVYNGARLHPSDTSVPDADMRVHTIFPCGIVSPGLEAENKIKPSLTRDMEKDDKPQHPDEIVRIALDRLDKGDFMITTMFLGHLMKGAGIGGSVRKSISDVFWAWFASIVILFVAPDFVRKCRNWGKLKGVNSTNFDS